MDDLYTKPGHLFRRMHQISVAIFMEECAAFDITPVQYSALVAIRNYPYVDATRLSSLIAFDKSTLGNVLERLEIKKLITRKANRKDRRVKHLTITHSGLKLLETVIPAVERAQERMLEPLTPADRTKLMALMATLTDLNNEFSRAPVRSLFDISL